MSSINLKTETSLLDWRQNLFLPRFLAVIGVALAILSAVGLVAYLGGLPSDVQILFLPIDLSLVALSLATFATASVLWCCKKQIEKAEISVTELSSYKKVYYSKSSQKFYHSKFCVRESDRLCVVQLPEMLLIKTK